LREKTVIEKLQRIIRTSRSSESCCGKASYTLQGEKRGVCV
jgi:hypothetical protein